MPDLSVFDCAVIIRVYRDKNLDMNLVDTLIEIEDTLDETCNVPFELRGRPMSKITPICFFNVHPERVKCIPPRTVSAMET